MTPPQHSPRQGELEPLPKLRPPPPSGLAPGSVGIPERAIIRWRESDRDRERDIERDTERERGTHEIDRDGRTYTGVSDVTSDDKRIRQLIGGGAGVGRGRERETK